MPRILWIEDSASEDMVDFHTALEFAGYDITVSSDVSDAEARISDKDAYYDLVIFDIRIAPGENAKWKQRWRLHGSNKLTAKLGLLLYRNYFLPEGHPEHLECPAWLDQGKALIISVEDPSEVTGRLAAEGIFNAKVFRKGDLPHPSDWVEVLSKEIKAR